MKRNYLLLLMAVAISFSAFAQKRVLWYADGIMADWEAPLKDSLVATGDFMIKEEVSALEFTTMTTANSFFLYDLVIMNESGPSNSGLNFGTGQAEFPKPLLSIEPYTFDDWFGVSATQRAGVADADQQQADPVQKFIVKAPNHPIFTGMLSAPGANDTITWTTGWNTLAGFTNAHICIVSLYDAPISKDVTLLASCEEIEREDPVAGKDNGLIWAVETNSTTKRIFEMGGHAYWLEFATPAYWQLLTNAAYWCVGMNVPVSAKARLSNQFDLRILQDLGSDAVKVQLSLTEAAMAELSVYSITGKIERNLELSLHSGLNEVNLNTTGLSSGLYFIALKINNESVAVEKFVK